MRRTGTPVAGRRSAGNETMTAVSRICFARTPLGCDMLTHPPYQALQPQRAARPQSIVSSLRDVRFAVCHIFLPGFRPCGTCAGDSAQRWRVSRNGAPASGEKKGEMGGEGKGSGNGTSQPAAHLPLFSPRLRGHHSAKRVSVERNPLHTSRIIG